MKIDASKDSVYAPVAVATNGTVTEWSPDAYDTLYVVSGKPVTLRPTYKLKSVVSGGEELNYNDGNGTVSFTVGAEASSSTALFGKSWSLKRRLPQGHGRRCLRRKGQRLVL